MSKDDAKFPASMSKKNEAKVDNASLKTTGNDDDNASDTNENEDHTTSTECRPSVDDNRGHHVNAATTLSGTATQQQAEDSSPSHPHMSSLLSQAWQQERHTQQTEAPPHNGQLTMNNSHNRQGFSFLPQPPSTQAPMPQSLLRQAMHQTIAEAQPATVSGTRPLGVNEPSSLHQSFVGHTQRSLGLNESSTLPPSLFGHDSAMNNSHNNRPDYSFVPQLSSTQAPLMPIPPSLLEQIQQALTTNQNLSGNPFAPQAPPMMAGDAATQAMARAHLLQQIPLSQNPAYSPFASHDQQQQQLSVSQNLSHFPIASHSDLYQSQMFQIQEYIRIREQISALLLMQQQGTTAAVPASTNPDFNTYNPMMQQGHSAMAMMYSQNPMQQQQGGGHHPAMAAAAAAAPAAFNPAQHHHTSSLNGINMMFDAPSLAAASQSTTLLAPQRPTNTPSHDAKEKRWLIRYEELREFHKVSYNIDIVLHFKKFRDHSLAYL